MSHFKGHSININWILIIEETYFLRTVSLVCHLNKNYTRKGHIPFFKKMPIIKVLHKGHSLSMNLILPSLVAREKRPCLRCYGHWPLAMAWKWPGREKSVARIRETTIIHMELPKGKETRLHLKSDLHLLTLAWCLTQGLHTREWDCLSSATEPSRCPQAPPPAFCWV